MVHWNCMIFKVPANPNHSVIPWYQPNFNRRKIWPLKIREKFENVNPTGLEWKFVKLCDSSWWNLGTASHATGVPQIPWAYQFLALNLNPNHLNKEKRCKRWSVNTEDLRALFFSPLRNPSKEPDAELHQCQCSFRAKFVWDLNITAERQKLLAGQVSLPAALGWPPRSGYSPLLHPRNLVCA